MIGGSVTMDMKLIDTDLQLGRMTYNDEIYLLKQHMNERYVMSLVSKTVDYTWRVTETSLWTYVDLQTFVCVKMFVSNEEEE